MGFLRRKRRCPTKTNRRPDDGRTRIFWDALVENRLGGNLYPNLFCILSENSSFSLHSWCAPSFVGTVLLRHYLGSQQQLRTTSPCLSNAGRYSLACLVKDPSCILWTNANRKKWKRSHHEIPFNWIRSESEACDVLLSRRLRPYRKTSS
jgi:hypothetical protein